MVNPAKIFQSARSQEDVSYVPAGGATGSSAQTGGGGGGGRELDLRQVIDILLRNKMLIIGVVVLGVLLTIFMVERMTPLYTTETSLVLERQRLSIAGRASGEPVVEGMRLDFFTGETQADILESKVLAQKVVTQLDLGNHELFQRAQQAGNSPGLMKSLKNLIGIRHWTDLVPESWLIAIGLIEPDSDEVEEYSYTPEELEAMEQEWLIGAYLSGLSVYPGDRSLVMKVSYTSPDPDFAALAANTLADVYILDKLNEKYETSERSNRWLTDRVEELRLRYENSSSAVEEFRLGAGLANIGDTSLYDQQLAGLNGQLIAMRTQLAEAEARYNQVGQLLKSASGVDAAAAVLDSALIQRLRETESQVQRSIAELETQYRDAHPKMILARSELVDLQAKIAQEVTKIATNLGHELEIVQVREQKLSAELEKLKTLIAEQNRAEVRLGQLDTNANTDLQLYESLLARFKEVDSQQQQLIRPDARVISYATAPSSPSFPRKPMLIVAGVLISTMIGIGLAFLREQLESGFRNPEQVTSSLGVPAISMLPRLPRASRAGYEPYEHVLDHPHSAYSESVRTLRTALLLSNVDNPPRTIAITSSQPNEGKTTTALSLARAAAAAGQKVLIIDCDLRKPSLHKALQVRNDQGLVQVLSHERNLEDIIEIDFRSQAHYILAGPKIANASDVLASDFMQELMDALRDAYDLVILDTPPVLAVSNTLVLTRQVDKTVFVVRWNKTRRNSASSAVRRLVESGADVAGVVLSFVDMKSIASYYGGSGSSPYHMGYKYYSES